MSSEAGKSDEKVQKMVEIILAKRGPDPADQPLLGKHARAIIDPHSSKMKELLDRLAEEADQEGEEDGKET